MPTVLFYSLDAFPRIVYICKRRKQSSPGKQTKVNLPAHLADSFTAIARATTVTLNELCYISE